MSHDLLIWVVLEHIRHSHVAFMLELLSIIELRDILAEFGSQAGSACHDMQLEVYLYVLLGQDWVSEVVEFSLISLQVSTFRETGFQEY